MSNAIAQTLLPCFNGLVKRGFGIEIVFPSTSNCCMSEKCYISLLLDLPRIRQFGPGTVFDSL